MGMPIFPISSEGAPRSCWEIQTTWWWLGYCIFHDFHYISLLAGLFLHASWLNPSVPKASRRLSVGLFPTYEPGKDCWTGGEVDPFFWECPFRHDGVPRPVIIHFERIFPVYKTHPASLGVPPCMEPYHPLGGVLLWPGSTATYAKCCTLNQRFAMLSPWLKPLGYQKGL